MPCELSCVPRVWSCAPSALSLHASATLAVTPQISGGHFFFLLFAPHQFLLFSFFSSLISFLSLFYFSSHLIFYFGSPSLVEIKWGKLPPTFPLGHLSSPYSSSYFPLFFFILFIASCNTWLNVSHAFQVYHMALSMCHSIGVPYGII